MLDDFTHHNVDTACALLETAGRFLYRLPETHTRMANMAEVSLCRLSDASHMRVSVVRADSGQKMLLTA